MTTAIPQTTAGHFGCAAATGSRLGLTMKTKTKTRIHGRHATDLRRHAAAAGGGHGLRRQPSLRLPWPPWAARFANLRHGRARVSGAACRRRSAAVRRRHPDSRPARGPPRRRWLHRDRRPRNHGGAPGLPGVHDGGGADANHRRLDHPGDRRSRWTRRDSPRGRRRRSVRLDASRESPRLRRCGRTNLGSRRSARHRGDRHRGDRRRHHRAAARHGHPRGGRVLFHRGGRDGADGRDGRRPLRLRLHLHGVRQSRCGVRQRALQWRRVARHRGDAAAGRHRGTVVAGRHRGGAVAGRRRGGGAAVPTERPRRRRSDGVVRRGLRGRPTVPHLWRRLWRRAPWSAVEPAVARGGFRRIR